MILFKHYISVKRSLLVGSVCFWGIYSQAQQDWNHTQYLFNLYDINAAYAGSYHVPTVAIRHRAQWMGITGAPRTSAVTFHAPMMAEKMGWGVRMQQERIGAREQWMLRPSLAYKVKMGDGRMSFSIAPAMVRQSMNPQMITAQDESDPQLSGTRWTATAFSADGALMYAALRWFAGIEFSHLNSPEMNWGNGSTGKYITHGNAVAGYLIKCSESSLLAITGLTRFTALGQTLTEANFTWLWNNTLWLGAGYRIYSGPSFLAEWNITPKMRVGYSTDMPLGKTKMYVGNSHEIFIGLNIGSYSPSSIRYF